MNIKDFLIKHPPIDDKVFGMFVEQRRNELGITLRQFAEETGISTTFLFDIEKGHRYAPINYLDSYQKILRISDSDYELFLDLAYCTRHNHPDINKYLSTTPKAREFLRIAKRKNLSDEELSSLILSLKNNKPCEDKEPIL